MGTYVEDHLLSIVLFLPAATALALLASGAVVAVFVRAGGWPGDVWRGVGLAGSAATFALAAAGVLGRFDPEHIGLQLTEYVPWLPALGVSYFVGVDGISLFLVLLATGLVPLALLASWRQIDRAKSAFVLCLLVLETGLLGVFLAQNAVLFLLAWQATLLPMFFLIGIFGGSRRVRAATRFLVVSGMGSALLLVAVLALFGPGAGEGGAWARFDWLPPPDVPAPRWSADPEWRALPVPATEAGGPWTFFALAAAFGLVMPIVPLHAWLPDAYREAPPAVAALLAAALLKMGAYGMLRLVLPLCPEAVATFAPAALGLALVAILYGSLVALAQRDLERLVAWWTIAQLGFVLLGTFSLEVHGLTGGVVAMLSHGLTVAALLFLVGAVAERRGSSEITAFGGLARPMPVFATLFGVATLSAMGAPFLSGFVGEWLVVLAGFGVDVWAGLAASAGWVIGAACLAFAFRRVALGPVHNPENRGLIDLDWRERVVVLALLVPVLSIGMHPDPVLRRIEPSVLELMRRMDAGRAAEVLPEETGAARPPGGAPPGRQGPDAPASAEARGGAGPGEAA